MKIKFLHLKPIQIVSLVLVLTLSFPTSIFARTLDDIQKEIDQKQAELDALNKDVNSAQGKLNSSRAAKNAAQGKLAALQAEIDEINDQIEYNKIKTEQLKQSTELK